MKTIFWKKWWIAHSQKFSHTYKKHIFITYRILLTWWYKNYLSKLIFQDHDFQISWNAHIKKQKKRYNISCSRMFSIPYQFQRSNSISSFLLKCLSNAQFPIIFSHFSHNFLTFFALFHNFQSNRNYRIL